MAEGILLLANCREPDQCRKRWNCPMCPLAQIAAEPNEQRIHADEVKALRRLGVDVVQWPGDNDSILFRFRGLTPLEVTRLCMEHLIEPGYNGWRWGPHVEHDNDIIIIYGQLD